MESNRCKGCRQEEMVKTPRRCSYWVIWECPKCSFKILRTEKDEPKVEEIEKRMAGEHQTGGGT